MVTDINRNADTDHDRIEELLSVMQDGAATPEEEALVARHLAGCARCRATAAAYRRVDERVVAYMRATPVPEMAPAWRAAAGRRSGRWTIGGGRGGLRVALVGVATVLLLLLGASALVQRAGNRDGPVAESQADTGAPAAAQAPARSAAGATAVTTAAAAPAAAPAPTRGAGAAGAPRAAATTGAAAAPTAAAVGTSDPTQTAAPTRAGAAAAATAPAVTTAPSANGGAFPAAPAAAPPVAARLNPVQRYDLAGAASLTLCLPLCEAEPRPGEVRDAVVRALDRDLALAGAPREPGGPPITLRFAFDDGRQVEIAYDRGARLLRLPDGAGYVVAPPELTDALVGLATP